MDQIRTEAVAGLFYPDDVTELRYQVHAMLDQARRAQAGAEPECPKALIVPHAGYVYSGPVAATAYATLDPAARSTRRVVLLGPSHRVAFRGMALCGADTYRTPLGEIPIDRDLDREVADLPGVRRLDAAHASEHSLEVQLPFLQCVLERFSLLPVVVGDGDDGAVAALLARVWGGPETLIVVSSDLSHYHGYEEARQMDAGTTNRIEAADYQALRPELACGCHPLRGLLKLARERRMRIQTLDLRNSGDTAGPRDQVVGYGSYAVYESH